MEETIRQNIKNFVSDNNTTLSAVARHLGISRSSLYEKLAGNRPWLLTEVIDLAAFMGCEEKDVWTSHQTT